VELGGVLSVFYWGHFLFSGIWLSYLSGSVSILSTRKRDGYEMLNDDQKIDFAKTIAEMLQVQLMMTPDHCTIASEVGGPKPKAIGYVYGYVDAALRSKGWNMGDMEIGPPITYHVVRQLWPGNESEYSDFLADHLSNLVVNAGILRGGQEYTDWLEKNEYSKGVPTGLAQYILTEV
jgi:hypothetical protein